MRTAQWRPRFRRRRESGSGSAAAMSRVSKALREQRCGGCARLDERRASRAACLPCGLRAQLAWASRYLCTMRAGELGRRDVWGRRRTGFLTCPNVPKLAAIGARSLDPGHCELAFRIIEIEPFSSR